MSIKIQTMEVSIAANKIEKINSKNRDSFTSLENSINKLGNNWAGTVSDVVINQFYSIKKTYLNDRYLIINDLVRFMRNQVADRYENTEKSIDSLSKAFK